MTQEDRKLLLVDLCARLPYGVLCEDMEGKTRPLFGITPTQHFIVTLDNATDGTNGLKFCTIDCIKPYLRPMSSMTTYEEYEYHQIRKRNSDESLALMDCTDHLQQLLFPITVGTESIDLLNAHHFDYRELIEKGLALEVPKGMYKFKDE